MNTVERPPYTANTGKPAGNGNYIFITAFLFFFLFLVTFAYIFYMCRRSRSLPPPTTTYDHHVIKISPGLDDDVLVTFPTFIYSEINTVTRKVGTGTDTDTSTADDNDSDCSICLAEYKAAEFVRVLPDCGHLFHVKCIDMWLRDNPTCPVCRNSALAGKGPTTTSTELSTYQ